MIISQQRFGNNFFNLHCPLSRPCLYTTFQYCYRVKTYLTFLYKQIPGYKVRTRCPQIYKYCLILKRLECSCFNVPSVVKNLGETFALTSSVFTISKLSIRGMYGELGNFVCNMDKLISCQNLGMAILYHQLLNRHTCSLANMTVT